MTEAMPLNLEQKLIVLKEHKIPAGKAIGCIDDRPIQAVEADSALKDIFVSPKEKGPQLLGGSLVMLPLLAETAVLSGKDPSQLNLKDLIAITFNATKSLNMEPGVHMDDNHSKLTLAQVIELVEDVKSGSVLAKISGCGFAALVTSPDNPLKLSAPVSQFFQSHSDLVEQMVRAGAKLEVLTGHHADKDKNEAMAVRNNDKQTTLDTAAARQAGVSAYNHDDWFFDDLVTVAVKALRLRNEFEWANQLRANAKKLNESWLKTTTKHLANMDPVAF